MAITQQEVNYCRGEAMSADRHRVNASTTIARDLREHSAVNQALQELTVAVSDLTSAVLNLLIAHETEIRERR